MIQLKSVKTLAVLLAAAGMTFSCKSGESQAAQEQPEEKMKVPVQQVFARDVEKQEVLTATVEAWASNNIAPKMSARIEKIYAEVGDRVVRGQKLAEVDPTSLIQARLQMENDSIEFSRTDELYAVGGISKSEWDARKMAYELTRTNYRNLLDNTILTSPISGVVTARNYDQGDMYVGGQALYVVEQLQPVKLLVNVTESLFTKVKKGMPVEITLDVYGDEVFAGKVRLVYPTVDPGTRTFPVEIEIANRDERVRPGMFARVILNYGVENNVVVPDVAVVKQTGSGDRYIYVYSDGKVDFRKVELGRRLDREYEILSGVNPGDRVVTGGQARLNDGMEVEITEN